MRKPAMQRMKVTTAMMMAAVSAINQPHSEMVRSDTKHLPLWNMILPKRYLVNESFTDTVIYHIPFR